MFCFEGSSCAAGWVKNAVDAAQFVKNTNKYWFLPGFHFSDKSLPSENGEKKQVPSLWCWISADNLGQDLQLLFLHFKAEFKPPCIFHDVPYLNPVFP